MEDPTQRPLLSLGLKTPFEDPPSRPGTKKCNAGAPILKCYHGLYNILAFDCHDICHKDPSKAKQILEDPKYDNDRGQVRGITLF